MAPYETVNKCSHFWNSNLRQKFIFNRSLPWRCRPDCLRSLVSKQNRLIAKHHHRATKHTFYIFLVDVSNSKKKLWLVNQFGSTVTSVQLTTHWRGDSAEGGKGKIESMLLWDVVAWCSVLTHKQKRLLHLLLENTSQHYNEMTIFHDWRGLGEQTF